MYREKVIPEKASCALNGVSTFYYMFYYILFILNNDKNVYIQLYKIYYIQHTEKNVSSLS